MAEKGVEVVVRFPKEVPLDIQGPFLLKSEKLLRGATGLDVRVVKDLMGDTMCFININENIIGNSLDAVDPDSNYSDDYDEYDGPIRVARSTEGDWFSPDNY